jgi:hypothetical protein
VSIKQLIYNYFEQETSSKKKRDKVSFGPSYLDKCARQIYYNKTKTPESNPIDTHTYIKFAMGNSVHDSLQGIFQKMGIWIEGEDFKEIKYQGLDWIYRIDGLLDIEGEKRIVEIKSVYASGYNFVEKKPKDDHIKQLIMYMLFEKIDKGSLIYIGRDNGYIIEYLLCNNQIWRLDGNSQFLIGQYPKIGYKRLKDIKDKIEKKELPERDYQINLKNTGDSISISFTKDKKKFKTAWQCSYCNWKDLCWEKELKEIKNNKFYIDGKFIK